MIFGIIAGIIGIITGIFKFFIKIISYGFNYIKEKLSFLFAIYDADTKSIKLRKGFLNHEKTRYSLNNEL